MHIGRNGQWREETGTAAGRYNDGYNGIGRMRRGNDSSKDADAKTEDTAKDAENGKTFTIGFDAEYPPYGYMDENGEYTGFDLELAEAVCELEGWELVKKPINWDSKDMELNSGSIGFYMERIYHERP